MKKKKTNSKLKLFLILIVGIVILAISGFIAFGFIQNKTVIKSPYISQVNFCYDSDAIAVNPTKVSGSVIYINKNCPARKINKPDLTTGEYCAFQLNYNDNCMNTITLREKICVNNIVSSEFVNCPNGCSFDKCL